MIIRQKFYKSLTQYITLEMNKNYQTKLEYLLTYLSLAKWLAVGFIKVETLALKDLVSEFILALGLSWAIRSMDNGSEDVETIQVYVTLRYQLKGKLKNLSKHITTESFPKSVASA